MLLGIFCLISGIMLVLSPHHKRWASGFHDVENFSELKPQYKTKVLVVGGLLLIILSLHGIASGLYQVYISIFWRRLTKRRENLYFVLKNYFG